MPGTIKTTAGVQTAAATAADYRFVCERQDDGNATIRLEKRTVTTVNGVTTETWSTAKTAAGTDASQSNAGWDDTIPWASGTYALAQAGSFAGYDYSWRMTPSPDGREGIRLHQGLQAMPSAPLKGCIGATAAFLGNANTILTAAGLANSSIPLIVKNDYGIGFAISTSTPTVNEGSDGQFTISLTGTGATNGVSKDMWLRVNLNGTGSGVATYSKTAGQGDFTVDPAPGSNGKIRIEPTSVSDGKDARYDAGFYVLLPKGQTSVTYTIHTFQDKPTQPAEGNETIDLTINDYYVTYRDLTSYSDYLTQPGVLLNGTLPTAKVTIVEQARLTSFSKDGGIEGYQNTFNVLPGDVIKISFDAYSIPDSLAVSDGVKTVGTNGQISGTYSSSITAQSDHLTVTVVGSASGTAWTFALLNQSASAAAGPDSSTFLGAVGSDAAASDGSANLAIAVAGEAGRRGLEAGGNTAAAVGDIAGGGGVQQPDSFAPLAAVAGSTLVQAASVAVTVPTTGTATTTFAAKAGVSYLVRLVSDPTVTGALADGYLKLVNQGDTTASIEVHTSDLGGVPATFFTASTDTTVTIQAGSDRAGQGGKATVEVYDASKLAAPIVYISPDQALSTVEGQDTQISVAVMRVGDVSAAATYVLSVGGSGSKALSANDLVGGFGDVAVTFAAGQSLATISLVAVNDGIVEGTELGIVTLKSGPGATEAFANAQVLGLATSAIISVSDATVTPNIIFPTIKVSDTTGYEGHGMAFTVSLGVVTDHAVTVGYVTADGTAKGASDYVQTSGTLTFAPGETSKTILLDLVNDHVTEGNETLTMQLLSPVGATLDGGVAVLKANGTILDARPTADFNADSHSDVIWRNTTGAISTWAVTGDGRQVQQGVYNGSAATSWKIADTFDLNGDGRADILWRNDSGAVAVWGSTSTGFNAATYFRAQPVSTNWRIAGTGDLNGDGKDDILWQNIDGAISSWTSTGTGFQENGYYHGSPGAGWLVQGVGDFNGDSRPDILWRNSNGAVALWTNTGQGTGFNETAFFQAGVPTSWHIDGIGDFNGDGKDDIVWRNDTGALSVWRGNGAGFDQGVYNSTVATNWQIAEIGDFNGDGKSDIFWRNDGGAVSIWQSNGAGFDQGVYNNNAPTTWSIAAHDFVL